MDHHDEHGDRAELERLMQYLYPDWERKNPAQRFHTRLALCIGLLFIASEELAKTPPPSEYVGTNVLRVLDALTPVVEGLQQTHKKFHASKWLHEGFQAEALPVFNPDDLDLGQLPKP